MFKGYINEKEYTDQGAYHRDLIEMQKSGKSFTANCSFSTLHDALKDNKELDSKVNDSLEQFVDDNVIDLKWLKNEYSNARDKKIFLKKIANPSNCDLPESQERRIEEFTDDELVSLIEIISNKKLTLDKQKLENRKELSDIDDTYTKLSTERAEVYDRLKKLNDKANDLMVAREDHEHTSTLIEALEAVYSNILEAVDTELESREVMNDVNDLFDDTDEEDEDDLAEEDSEDDEAEDSLNDILKNFKALYEKLLG